MSIKIDVIILSHSKNFNYILECIKNLSYQTINPNNIIICISETNFYEKKYLENQINKLNLDLNIFIDYVDKEQNLSQNRNRGIDYCINNTKPDYIMFCDSNNIIHSKKIEYFLYYLLNININMFVHNYANYNEYLNINEKYILDNNKIILYNNSIYNNIHYSNIIIKLELCKIIRYDENLIIGENEDFFNKIYEEYGNIYYFDEKISSNIYKNNFIMKKVITFSLWGNNEIYTIGTIKNLELAKIFYPDFECWVYIHVETVPKNIIDEISNFDNSKIILKSGILPNCKPMMWRFEAIDEPEVEIMMSRDTDTRILLREKLAVDEWLNSNKLFHIMRDHPHHGSLIQGGMFGTKKNNDIQNWKNLILNLLNTLDKQYDQDFLSETIYPLIKNNSLKHCSFNLYEDDCINFPINYCNEYKFVGEYVYHDDSRSQYHIDILKNEINKNLKINLITSFYIIHKDGEKINQRNNELVDCLIKNLNCKYISKIYLYVDDIISLNKAIELNVNNKLHIISVGKQPLYSEMFEYCIDNLSNKICMISNSDIYLHSCDVDILNQLNNSIYCLSRHESNLKCEVYGYGSHDAFIFYPKYIDKNILKNLEHYQNIAGSDDNIINNFVDNGYKLYNPCFEIMIIHLHSSEVRTYNNNIKIAHGKYYIKQEYLKKIENYTFFHGVDYIGSDVNYKENTFSELKFYCDNYDEIVAFNTLGFIKNNIDLNKLVETEWINKNTKEGIYIKNKYL